jgi:hypothetical protein
MLLIPKLQNLKRTVRLDRSSLGLHNSTALFSIIRAQAMIGPNRCTIRTVRASCIHRPGGIFQRHARHREITHRLVGVRDIVKRVMALAPSPSTNGRKLDHRVKRDGNGHASIHTGVAKVRHETLKDAYVADDQGWHDFLFQSNDDASQARHQVAVAFASGKTES